MNSKIARNFFKLFSGFFLSIPVYQLRVFFLRLFLKKMGKNIYVGRNLKVISPYNICIGDNVVINDGVLLDGRRSLNIGNNVDIARDAAIWTLQHDYNDDYHRVSGGPVHIEDYCWICYRSVVLPNILIGRGAVVAAGALVTKNIPPLKVYGGIPAHEINTRMSGLKYELIFKPHFYE